MTQNTKTVFPHATDIEKVFLIVIQFDLFLILSLLPKPIIFRKFFYHSLEG